MNYLGSDFNSTGSVMPKADLATARLKRGECLTCGRKCFRKKLFKMIPLNEKGKVLNGRCLNCKPLQPKDAPMPSHSEHKSSDTKHDRSINIAKSGSSFELRNRRSMTRDKKSFTHQQNFQWSPRYQHHNSNPHLLKSNSAKGVAFDEMEASFKGEGKAPPTRTRSTPLSANSHYNGLSGSRIFRNRLHSTHSNISRSTVDTALSTRPSFASSSTPPSRKNKGNSSAVSNESISSGKAADSISKDSKRSTSGHSFANTDSIGGSTGEQATTRRPEISWTPPPHHSEFGNSTDDVSNTRRTRSSSKHDSQKSVKSTSSKHHRPSREELEQAAFTLMSARQHGLKGAVGNLYEDMFDKLASSDDNVDIVQDSSNGKGMAPHSKNHNSNAIDSIASNGGTIQDDDHIDGVNIEYIRKPKGKRDTNSNNPIIESVRNPEAIRKHSLPGSLDQYLEQDSIIAESNVSNPKAAFITEEDELLKSTHSHQPTQDRSEQGILNRGGAFQSRHFHGHGRPGVGTHVFAGSSRTLSSMSSIGEEDHLLVQESQDLLPNRRQAFTRMGSFSRYRQGSCRTLGSLSTIEIIKEEESGLQSSLEDLSVESFSIDRQPVSMAVPVTIVRPKEEISHQDVHQDLHQDERKEDPIENQEASWLLDPRTRTDENIDKTNFKSTNQENEDNIDAKVTCKRFREELIVLRDSYESPDQTKKALKALAECKFTCDDEQEIDLCDLEIVVNSIQTYALDYDVQVVGCRAILNMSSSSAQIRDAFVHAGAPDLVTQAMKQYLTSGKDLQEVGIAVITILATNPSNVNYLIDKGEDAVDAIITAMGQYPGDERLQTNGCEALATLTSHNDSKLQLRIMDKGAGEAILFNAVAMHSQNAVVQKFVLLAIYNLSSGCEENQTKFLEMGVVDPILSAMKKHRNTSDLQAAGARTISILAGNNVETKRVIEENGGIELILRAILDHSDLSKGTEDYICALMALSLDTFNANHFESRSSENSIKVAEVVKSIVEAIGISKDKADTPRLSLAINATITALEANEDASAVQEVGFAVLKGLAGLAEEGIAKNTDQTKMYIVDEGALDSINMAMVLFSHEMRVQERACAVLLSLAIEENYASISAAIGTQLLEDAAKNFPDRCYDLANTLIQRLSFMNEDSCEE